MSTTTVPTWLTQLRELETMIRQLDLRFHADATAEPAPAASADQVHTALWAKARVTSHGTPILELEYSGCFRLLYQAPPAAALTIDRRAAVVEAAGAPLASQSI